MELSKSKNSLCLIRGFFVSSTPEEQVRQTLLQDMIGPLGYPRGLVAVEKDLASLSLKTVPSDSGRRVDVLCFYPAREGIAPLLLIECKAGTLDLEAENQLFGYNASVGAPFLCLANSAERKLLWRERGKIVSIPFLPSYTQLIEKL